MSNQLIDPNAKQALNNFKMEIANEIQDNSNILNDGTCRTNDKRRTL